MTLRDLIKEKILYEAELFEIDNKEMELVRRRPAGGESASQNWQRIQKMRQLKAARKEAIKQNVQAKIAQSKIAKQPKNTGDVNEGNK